MLKEVNSIVDQFYININSHILQSIAKYDNIESSFKTFPVNFASVKKIILSKSTG